MKQISVFDEEKRQQRLRELGDPLEKVTVMIDWTVFEPILAKAFPRVATPQGGRPPYPAMLMFKILLLQQWNNLSDDQTEYLINDRLSYQKFLGLGINSQVPDAKTIWLYRERFKETLVYQELFDMFAQRLEEQGVITRKGSIVDSTFVDVPRGRNTREENQELREGKTPEEWKKRENQAKLEQKDRDARWAKKNNETHYGYKGHAKVDAESKLVTQVVVSAANEHDSQAFEELLDEKDQVVYADSAYQGEAMHKRIQKTHPKMKLCIQAKGYRNHPLTQEQKEINRKQSKTRCRIEHVFGHMTNAMGGLTIRTIGFFRAQCNIIMKFLAYNLQRYSFLRGAQKQAAAV